MASADRERDDPAVSEEPLAGIFVVLVVFVGLVPCSVSVPGAEAHVGFDASDKNVGVQGTS